MLQTACECLSTFCLHDVLYNKCWLCILCWQGCVLQGHTSSCLQHTASYLSTTNSFLV